MFRVQVWDDVAKAYSDVQVLFDRSGPIGFNPASNACAPTEYERGMEALQEREALEERAEGIFCVIDLTTGKRHFDDGHLLD